MNIKTAVSDMEKYYKTDITKNLHFREKQLELLAETIKKFEGKIVQALKADLNKAPQESYMTEIGIVLDEIKFAHRHLNRWSKRKWMLTPIGNFPALSYTYREPYGVVLVISPWNYPFQLALSPLVGAIAAGNCCILKPSEFSPHVSAVLSEMVKAAFDPHYITVVEGAVEESQALLAENLDYIFFTGNPMVGQIVMTAAAKHLTPVTLELGGKSPCIVHSSADISLAAKRIVFGKFLNAGQTCVAPDYILCDQCRKKELVYYLKHYIKAFFGEEPLRNEDYPRIITRHHYDRLMALIAEEEIAMGGKGDSQTLQIEPTVLTNIQWDSPVMADEIFGPILPILTYGHLDIAIADIARREKPLALYIFAKDELAVNSIIESLSFGGGCINDTIVHLLSPRMPFGGVGKSGMGQYHGKNSFVTFSHEKSMVRRLSFPDISLRYHPYSERKLRWIRRFLG